MLPASDDLTLREAAQRKRNLGLFCVAAGLYVVACALPALYFQKGGQPADTWPGWGALFLGWLGLFLGIFAWLANPLLALSWMLLLLGQVRLSRLFSTLSIPVGLSMCVLWGMELPGDEGGVTKMQVSGIGLGTYLWFTCLLLTAGATWLSRPYPQKLIPPPVVRSRPAGDAERG